MRAAQFQPEHQKHSESFNFFFLAFPSFTKLSCLCRMSTLKHVPKVQQAVPHAEKAQAPWSSLVQQLAAHYPLKPATFKDYGRMVPKACSKAKAGKAPNISLYNPFHSKHQKSIEKCCLEDS